MSVKCILADQAKGGGSGGSGIVLKKLEITKFPLKTDYFSGESFDPSGMELTASYGIAQSEAILTTAIIPVANCSINPTIITDSTQYVYISYTESGVTVSTRLSISVNASLRSLTISSNPTKTTYAWEESFNTNGLEVTATYSDDSTKIVTNYVMKIGNITITNGTQLNDNSFSIGSNQVIVSFTDSESNETVSTNFNITITKKQLAVPSQSGNLTYNGNNQSPTLNNFNSSLMTISGNSQTNAGSYIAIIGLRDTTHYEWTGGTIDNKNVNWSIGKAQGSLSLDKTSVEISGSELTQTVTITRSGDGIISYSPISIAGLTLSLNGNILTITGDGATVIDSQTITISVAEGTNYIAPSNKSIIVSAVYWEWGNESTVGDASWWTGLKSWITTASNIDLQNCVGKEKKVTLTSSVLNTTTHLVRCIGANQDADKTLTFQTSNCLKEKSYFGYIPSEEDPTTWIGSHSRELCINYYNAFPSKSAIKTVKKGTCPSTNFSRNGTPTYNNETVFLLSEREMGLDSYAPLSTANSTVSKAECTQGKNFSYSYYTSNGTRAKRQGDSGSLISHWLRSRCYNTTPEANVCAVNSDGTANRYTCNGVQGLAPAFVIG